MVEVVVDVAVAVVDADADVDVAVQVNTVADLHIVMSCLIILGVGSQQ